MHREWINIESSSESDSVIIEEQKFHEELKGTSDTDTNDENLRTLIVKFCICDVDGFISKYQAMKEVIQKLAQNVEENYIKVSNDTGTEINESEINQLKGTVYENFVIYSKNDINLQILKQFEYDTEIRTTATGRPQTIYIWKYDDCKKEFLRTCNLLDHMRMHSGIKPNMCDFWGKGFTQKSNLRKHLKIHVAPELEQRKRYTCSECGSKYTERYNFKKHLRKAHGVNQ